MARQLVGDTVLVGWGGDPDRKQIVSLMSVSLAAGGKCTDHRESREQGHDQAWPGAGGLMRVLNKFKSSLQFFLLLEYILLAKIEKTIFVVT